MWSPLWSILVSKIPQFWAKATASEDHHTLLESRHPEVTENSYYDSSPERSQKKVLAHGLSKAIVVLTPLKPPVKPFRKCPYVEKMLKVQL